jgi:hypothetical protein
MIDLLADELPEGNATKILDLMYTYLGKWCMNGVPNTSNNNSINAMTNGAQVIHTLADLQGGTENAGHQDHNNLPFVNALQQPKETGGWTHYSHSGG